MKTENFKNQFLSLILVILVLVAIIAFGGFRYYLLNKELKSTRGDLAELESQSKERIEVLESSLSTLSGENNRLSEALYSEQTKNQAFESQINEIADTVGILDKLRKTDPELLQKYSKVYFLNEHYVPGELDEINSEFIHDKSRPFLIHAKVKPFLENLMRQANNSGIKLRILSAFRSFNDQQDLKTNYKITYGSGANKFSADQGYSEHQLGTTIDFTTEEHGARFNGFEETEAYSWLKLNAHKFGFVLSYPEGNEYYLFEPWHWRFVGVKLATDLYREGKSFYDLDQREIDEYLVYFLDSN